VLIIPSKIPYSGRLLVMALSRALRGSVYLLSVIIPPVFLLTLLSAGFAEGGPHPRSVKVSYVIDGDTIITTSGERLRYLGIDTPEKGEKFFSEATVMNKALLKAGPVKIIECGEEKEDKYGRTLAWVYSGGMLINGELLSRGLARLLLIPPCGLEKRSLMESLAWEARSEGRGIWAEEGGIQKASHVSPAEADGHIGHLVVVDGVISSVRERGKVVFIDFNASGERAFRAVLFSDRRKVFLDAGIDFMSYIGKKVSIAGVLRSYRGRAEIILLSPGQLRLKPGS